MRLREHHKGVREVPRESEGPEVGEIRWGGSGQPLIGIGPEPEHHGSASVLT